MSKKTAQKSNRLSNSDLITVSARLVEMAYKQIDECVISLRGFTWFTDINGKPCRISIEALDGLAFADRYPNRNKDIDLPF